MEQTTYQTAPPDTVAIPSPRDVLLPSTEMNDRWPGNVRLQNWVERRQEAYIQATTRSEKTCIALELVNLVAQKKGRFLNQEDPEVQENNNTDRMNVKWTLAKESDILLYLGRALRSRRTTVSPEKESLPPASVAAAAVSSSPPKQSPTTAISTVKKPNETFSKLITLYITPVFSTNPDNIMLRPTATVLAPAPSARQTDRSTTSGAGVTTTTSGSSNHKGTVAMKRKASKIVLKMKKPKKQATASVLSASGTQQPQPVGDGDDLLTLPKGVTQRASGKWQAQIYFAGASRYIGVFNTSAQANTAYHTMEKYLLKFKGEVSKFNKEQLTKIVNVGRKDTLTRVAEMFPWEKSSPPC